MDKELQEKIIKRLKSFGWRTGCFMLVAGISYVSDNMGILEIPMWIQIGLGGILGEATKWLNNNTALFGARLK